MARGPVGNVPFVFQGILGQIAKLLCPVKHIIEKCFAFISLLRILHICSSTAQPGNLTSVASSTGMDSGAMDPQSCSTDPMEDVARRWVVTFDCVLKRQGIFFILYNQPRKFLYFDSVVLGDITAMETPNESSAPRERQYAPIDTPVPTAQPLAIVKQSFFEAVRNSAEKEGREEPPENQINEIWKRIEDAPKDSPTKFYDYVYRPPGHARFVAAYQWLTCESTLVVSCAGFVHFAC